MDIMSVISPQFYKLLLIIVQRELNKNVEEGAFYSLLVKLYSLKTFSLY